MQGREVTAADPRKATLLFPKPALAAANGAPVATPSEAKPTKRRGKAGVTAIYWEAIEPEYTNGILSLRQLAKKHGASPSGITKYAEKHGWVRDDTARINAHAQAIVDSIAVDRKVDDPSTVLTKRVREQTIAEIQADVRLGQRDSLTRLRKLAELMFDRLEGQIVLRDGRSITQIAQDAQDTLDEKDAALAEGNVEMTSAQAFERVLQRRDVLERVGEDQFRPNKAGRDPVNELYHAVISTPGEIKALKDLSEALRTIIDKEREAYRIDKMPDDTGSGGRTSLPVRFVEPVQRVIEHDPD